MRRALTSQISWSILIGSLMGDPSPRPPPWGLTGGSSCTALGQFGDGFIDQATMILFGNVPADRFCGNQGCQLSGLVPQLVQGLILGSFNLAPQSLPLRLDFLGRLHPHLFLELFRVAS